MPLTRPEDAPHKSCNDCWQGLVYDVDEYFRCAIHYGQNLPGSAERKRREEFRELVEGGQLPATECVRCWNGRRQNPGFQCPEHRVDENIRPGTGGPPPLPEINEAVLNPTIIIPEKGVIDPYTGQDMCQMEIDAMMAEPENNGKSFAEVMEERRQTKAWLDNQSTQRVQKVQIEEEDIILKLDFLGIWNLFTNVIEATGIEFPNEMDSALGRALRGHLDYQIKKHHLTLEKKREEETTPAVPGLPEETDLIQWDDSPPIKREREIEWAITPITPVPVGMVVENPNESESEEKEEDESEAKEVGSGEKKGSASKNETDDEKKEFVNSILAELLDGVAV